MSSLVIVAYRMPGNLWTPICSKRHNNRRRNIIQIYLASSTNRTTNREIERERDLKIRYEGERKSIYKYLFYHLVSYFIIALFTLSISLRKHINVFRLRHSFIQYLLFQHLLNTSKKNQFYDEYEKQAREILQKKK